MEDNIIFDKKFIKVKECVNTPYFYAERLGIDSIGFILYDKKTEKYGLIYERKPPMDQRVREEKSIRKDFGFKISTYEAFLATAFGGSNDKVKIEEYKEINEISKFKLFTSIVKDEVIEEAGYKVESEDITYVTKAFVSTQQNQLCYLFIVDVTNKEYIEPQYENEVEAMSEVVWLTKSQIVKDTIDWKAKTILFTLDNL